MAPRHLRPILVPSLALLGALGIATGASADSTSARAVAAQQAVVHVGATAAISGEPSREKFGHADLYVPTFFRPAASTYDLVVHFHGIPSLQEDNFERAGINAVVVSINLGLASDAYSGAYRAPGSFDALLDQIQRAMDRTGRAPGARLGRIALSAWSAGFAAVGAILKQPGVPERVDAVLLADGPHAAYIAPHQVYQAGIEKWVRFAESAMRGDKLFALTHSSIQTTGYPSTTETIGEVLKATNVEKVLTPAIGPRGMHEIYESHRGDFHVEGFEGQTAKDHIDHIKGMSETLLPYLHDRWSSR
jgi:hypothetical protein